MESEREQIEERMQLPPDEWEKTVERIANECNHLHPRKTTSILKKWRAKLEKEPTLLQLHQIDKIVREVRDRLGNASRLNGFGKARH